MKKTLALTLIATLAPTLGCTNEPTSQSVVDTASEHVLVGDETSHVVMTESGDGTPKQPLGVDFNFVNSQSADSQQ